MEKQHFMWLVDGAIAMVQTKKFFTNVTVIALLLKRGANINAVTAKKNTPLHLAV